ncbi:MAG: FdhD protein [Thermoleophilaceae bacterium]|nr:FdhD protein [Thermoleophilaceae bacterium]
MERTFDRHVDQAWIERVPGRERERDELAVEEPLEIRVDGEPLAVTMRTPGEDEELAVGFLAGEGLIAGPADVDDVGPAADLAANVVDVRTAHGLRRDPSGERTFYLSSSCGVCGKGALEHVRQWAPPALPSPPVATSVVLRAPDEARRAQRSFDRTGGLHATALFDHAGEMLVIREDVGRHNAMDKAIGSMLLAERFPLPGAFACLSGRASFELVQKASLAGLAGLVAVGAPSTLAVELARDRDMLLCGFVRGDSFNVYSGSHRLSG